jgi:solute carrier family 25 carnitine/acylcarnitine transporter 20/29
VNTYDGPVHCLQSIYRRYGLRGCFHGLGATVLREIPGLTMYIVSYEYMMGMARKAQGNQGGQLACPLHVNLVVGGLSGMLSWAINIPFDIIKSRLQSDDLANPKYRGIRDCAVRLYQEGGVRVFWRGLPVVCMRAFPTNAVTFTVYTNTLLYIYNMQQKPPREAGPTVLD